jgi:hypothetical protein
MELAEDERAADQQGEHELDQFGGARAAAQSIDQGDYQPEGDGVEQRAEHVEAVAGVRGHRQDAPGQP